MYFRCLTLLDNGLRATCLAVVANENENVGNSIACNSKKFFLRLIFDVCIIWIEIISAFHDDQTNDDISIYVKYPPIRMCVSECLLCIQLI